VCCGGIWAQDCSVPWSEVGNTGRCHIADGLVLQILLLSLRNGVVGGDCGFRHDDVCVLVVVAKEQDFMHHGDIHDGLQMP